MPPCRISQAPEPEGNREGGQRSQASIPPFASPCGICLEKQLPGAWYAHNSLFTFNCLKIPRGRLNVYFQTLDEQSLLSKLECGRARAGSSWQPGSCKRHVGMSDVPPHSCEIIYYRNLLCIKAIFQGPVGRMENTIAQSMCPI